MSGKINMKIDIEKIVRNVLIILTLISLVITFFNFTYLTYQDRNIDRINDFLIHYINGWLLWFDNILLYIFSIWYIILGIKSRKEVLLKVFFSIFSILTAVITLTFIVNFLANLFRMF